MGRLRYNYFGSVFHQEECSFLRLRDGECVENACVFMKGELSVGEAGFPVCRTLAAAFAYALSLAASVMILSAGSLEILRLCIVSSTSLGSLSNSSADKTGARDSESAM